ncbi:MAG TPA: helix-turn-helix domain-containing protein [Candidatus Olsenella pullistercoris]|uniref:Helix-turn-helix domain-containing protein n=1 Tax=Candidatus Olsenella pullistercoris TaxID=2838712 RepID=A0A9D2EYS5_9ACTN|nr:helix-turn-helix domain-containing protein [Candidatus Olsenella pullistercoris]
MDVGNQIRERRQRLGLSQEELAQRLYVSRVTISHWETGRTLPDVQSMLLLANLFGTTIDEMVRGDVDEMREMVEKDERRTRTLAVALAAVEVVAVTALAVTAVAGREYLEPALRLLLAVLALAFSVAVLASRRGRGDEGARSAAELLGAATGEPVEAARASGAALGMRVVLQVFVGLAVGIGVLVAADVLLDPATFRKLAVVLAVAATLAGSFALGRLARPTWAAAVLPALWVAGAVALGAATGGLGSPRDWFAVAGGAVVLLAFWAIGRSRRG